LNPAPSPARNKPCGGSWQWPAKTAIKESERGFRGELKHVVGGNQAFRQDQVAALHSIHNLLSTQELIDQRFPTKISPYN